MGTIDRVATNHRAGRDTPAEEKREQAEILLRAADGQASGDTLLRPASGNSETAPEQLLRPNLPEHKE